MSTKIAVTQHTSAIKTNLINKICKPLFDNTVITYFCYLRRYRNGKFTFLPSMIDVGDYFFGEGVYPDTWFGGADFDAFNSGYLLLDLAKQVCADKTKCIAKQVAENFNIFTGVDIIEKYQDYCDFYYFASASPEIYSIGLDYLQKFVFYFKSVAPSLIIDAQADKLTLIDSDKLILSSTLPIIQLSTGLRPDDNNDFKTKRYYLSGQYEGIFLTKREVEILQHLNQGDVVKNLAEKLHVSPRTLEHHVTNIKEKLDVSRLTQILNIVRDNKIIM